jgi:hypothetical protein
LPNLVLASGNEECLLGTKAAFFDSGTNLIPQFGARDLNHQPPGAMLRSQVFHLLDTQAAFKGTNSRNILSEGQTFPESMPISHSEGDFQCA